MRFPHVALAVVISLSPWVLQGSFQDNIGPDITRAEALYYQAHYKEADALLAFVSDRIDKSGASAASQVQVKMLLGLTRFVLGNEPDARSHFLDLCVVNPAFVLDEHRFAPKVVSFFNGVHEECMTCRGACFRASSLAAAGDLQEADRTRSGAEYSSCSCTAWASKADNPGFQHANDLLDHEKYVEALREFKGLTQTFPENPALRDAANSLQKRINGSVQSGVAEWRESFLLRRFEQAAAVYERIQPSAAVSSGEAKEAFRQVTTSYQAAFQEVVASWTTACSRDDAVSLAVVRNWGKSLDPNRIIHPDVLDRIQGCGKPLPATSERPASTVSLQRNEGIE
jgi:hypothetical protein